jgi:membrane fusion protein, adhesin transport system
MNEATPTCFPSNLALAGRLDPYRTLNRLLLALIFGGLPVLLLSPWRQNVPGQGRVIAYAPVERQQTVDAPIVGRVVKWHVQEGDFVTEGQLIAEMADNDPDILDRLERERSAAQSQIEAIDVSLTVTEGRIAALETVRTSAVLNAALRRDMADDRKRAAQRALDAARASLVTAELQLERQRKLHEKGLASTRELELAELQQATSAAEVDRATATLEAATREVRALVADRDKTAADALANIESARATIQQLRASRAQADGDLARIDVRLSQQRRMQVYAPRPGTVLRVIAREGGEMLTVGEPIALLVPKTEAVAVELWVDGNDAPLVTPGRTARLQFEGWPAIQFVGWPSVAIGTFPAVVSFVDATDDGRGRFRIVVIPQEPDDWPDTRWLRQGVRTKGWILLNEVSVGFELWRQFNGFPPSIDPPVDDSTAVLRDRESRSVGGSR